MSQFTNGRTAVSSFFMLTGLLVAGLALAASMSVVAVTAAFSTPSDRATDSAATEPPVAATEPDTDPQDATSPVTSASDVDDLVTETIDLAQLPDRWEVAAQLNGNRPAEVASSAETADVADTSPPPAGDQPTNDTVAPRAADTSDDPAPSEQEATEAPAPQEPVPQVTETSASSSVSQLARVEAIADRMPFAWRSAGVSFRVGCPPNRSTCHWGLYVSGSRTIWIGPGAFESDARLFYVVAHEVAHSWQYASNDPAARLSDLSDWGRTGVDGLEAAADCLAQAWGASTTYYWNCPSDARAHMQQVFASTR